jgi:hypothetical protein
MKRFGQPIARVALQGYWAAGASWWPGSLEAKLGNGEVEIRVDPTPLYREVNPEASLSLTI